MVDAFIGTETQFGTFRHSCLDWMRSGGSAAMPIKGKTHKKPISEIRRKSMNKPMKDRYRLHPSFLFLRMAASFYPHKLRFNAYVVYKV